MRWARHGAGMGNMKNSYNCSREILRARNYLKAQAFLAGQY
jgi:hypothetical protein